MQSWIPLKYHGSKSDLSSRYLQNMVAPESSTIEFAMSPYGLFMTYLICNSRPVATFPKTFMYFKIIFLKHQICLQVDVILYEGMTTWAPCVLGYQTTILNSMVLQEGAVTLLISYFFYLQYQRLMQYGNEKVYSFVCSLVCLEFYYYLDSFLEFCCYNY